MKDRADRGIITIQRRNEYITFIRSGGEKFPDRIMTNPCAIARNKQKTRFRAQFQKQVKQ